MRQEGKRQKRWGTTRGTKRENKPETKIKSGQINYSTWRRGNRNFSYTRNQENWIIKFEQKQENDDIRLKDKIMTYKMGRRQRNNKTRQTGQNKNTGKTKDRMKKIISLRHKTRRHLRKEQKSISILSLSGCRKKTEYDRMEKQDKSERREETNGKRHQRIGKTRQNQCCQKRWFYWSTNRVIRKLDVKLTS